VTKYLDPLAGILNITPGTNAKNKSAENIVDNKFIYVYYLFTLFFGGKFVSILRHLVNYLLMNIYNVEKFPNC
jgi:hypothetical protein